MTHLDLFSGIGGFALAAKEVWGDEYECVGFCEIDKYCQKILSLRFKGVPIYGDIRELTTDTTNTGFESMQKWENGVFLLTGGFPCQPFSQAGKRRGKKDDRFLWPQMLRCIREFKPTWVIAENVYGLVNIEGGLVLEQVLSEMENEGYEVQPFIIPACAVNAPHRRNRIWIVANCKGGRISKPRQSWKGRSGLKNEDTNVADTTDNGQYRNDTEGRTESELSADKKQPRHRGPGHVERCHGEYGWEQNWIEVATELCRMDAGLPAELDGFKLSKSRHRQERLKALGNSIVPQVVKEIMYAIKELNNIKSLRAEG